MSEMLGPPPAYAEAISSSSASSTRRPASANATNNGTIWTIPVPPPDIGQLTPPPSYAETLRANPGHGRCSRCARVHSRGRQGHGQGQRGPGPLTSSSSELAQPNSSPSSSFPSFLCSRHLHRCPSRQRHNGNVGNGLNLVFPADRHRTELARRASRDVESLGTIPEEPRRQGGSCADKFRDLFLTVLMRVLLIFLFVVFMRILIAQLSPEET